MGCRNLGRLEAAFAQVRKELQRWEVGTYRVIDKISKYMKDDEIVDFHCWKKEVQIWKEKNRMQLAWCCIKLNRSV